MHILLLLCGALSAQDTVPADTTPFRSGQWATQFGGALNFATIGFIKFRSPTRATILDLRLRGSHREHFVNDSLRGIESFAGIDVKLGRRSYRPVARTALLLHTMGIMAGLDHSVSTTGGGRFTGDGWSAGLFGDFGGLYLASPQLGIGAVATTTLEYSRQWQRASSGKAHSWGIAGDFSVMFAVTVFF